MKFSAQMKLGQLTFLLTSTDGSLILTSEANFANSLYAKSNSLSFPWMFYIKLYQDGQNEEAFMHFQTFFGTSELGCFWIYTLLSFILLPFSWWSQYGHRSLTYHLQLIPDILRFTFTNDKSEAIPYIYPYCI